MGMVFGYLSLICFCLLAAKGIARSCGLVKIDQALMKIHRPVSLLLAGFCVLHICLVLPVLRSRALLVTVSGALAVVFLSALLLSCHTLKQKDGRMRWHRRLTVLMAVCIVLHGAAYFLDLKAYQRNIERLIFQHIELSDAEDGTYIGECDAGYLYAKVSVVMEGGRIASIELLEHRNERGGPAEELVDRVVAAQEIDVDAVSGATNSSKVIKKAIENAILQASRGAGSVVGS